MGQAMSSETLSISGGDGHRYWVGLKMKPFGKGCKKTVFKGVLLGSGPRQWEKVIAKAFTDLPGTKEDWAHEVNKADLTRQLAASFLQQHRRFCKISVVIPGIVQMDKVSHANNWLASKNGVRGLDKSEWISVEEFIPGRIFRYSPWNVEHPMDNRESIHLQTFSHFTYKHSRGTLVACDFQGTCDNDKDIAHYTFTDSIIHSSTKMYGLFDRGEYGITEFFKRHQCNDICRDWPRPTPLTPPPTFDEACAALQLQLTPPPAFENIVFSSHPVEPLQNSSDEDLDTSDHPIQRRRHASAHGTRSTSRASNSLQVSNPPMRRRSFSSANRSNTLGAPEECIPVSPQPAPPPRLHVQEHPSAPPSYDSLDIVPPLDLRRRSATFNGIENHYSDASCPSAPTDSFNAGAAIYPNLNDYTHQHFTEIAERQNLRAKLQNIQPLQQQQNQNRHPELAVTLSEPECQLRALRSAPSSQHSSPRQPPAIPQSRSNAGSPTPHQLTRMRSSSTSSMSALRRRRMLTQNEMTRTESCGQVLDEPTDMVQFYLGVPPDADRPSARLTPSAPSLDDDCFSND